jgi:hypothetical protein
MTKKFSILLVFSLILSLTVCFAGCDKENSLPDDNSQPTSQIESDTTSTDSKEDLTSSNLSDTTSEKDKETSKNESSKPSTSTDKTSSQAKPTTSNNSQQKPTEPEKLNPKTNIKFDEYFYGEFFSADKKTYSKLNFAFHGGGEFSYSYDFNLTTYFTKERCVEKLAEFDMEFDEEEFKNSTITVNGVTYYTLGWLNYGAARLCKFTDTAIKLCDDSEEIATLSLRKDGTLVIDSVAKDEYGPVGTVFKMK